MSTTISGPTLARVSSVVLYEAYMQLNYFSRVNLRVGKFKPPVGLERLQSDDDTNFIERGYPTLLVPSRDIGYQFSGDIVKRRVAYQVGVFNGVPDNGLSGSLPEQPSRLRGPAVFHTVPAECEESAERAGLRHRRDGREYGRDRVACLQDLRAEYVLHVRVRRVISGPSDAPGSAGLLLRWICSRSGSLDRSTR